MQTARALIIAHEADGPGGQVAVRLAERGYECHTHVVTTDVDAPNTSVPFPSFTDYDVVAIMGSIRSLTNKPEIDNWVHEEMDLISEAHDADTPVLGICFGGQLIAEALGGSVEESPVTEIGWHEIRPAEGQQNPAGPGPWMQWHHDRIIAPPGATVLAETDSATQLFTVGKMVGTQFHPEVDYAHVDYWLETADDDYLAQYGQERNEILDTVRAHEERNIKQCHDFVDWFLDTMVDGPSDSDDEPAPITTTGTAGPSDSEETA